jgi:hypothetical protein
MLVTTLCTCPAGVLYNAMDSMYILAVQYIYVMQKSDLSMKTPINYGQEIRKVRSSASEVYAACNLTVTVLRHAV